MNTTCGIRQKPNLADAVQNLDDLLQESNMERWKCKLDIAKMTITVFELAVTGIALDSITGRAHALVKRAMPGHRAQAIIRGSVVGMAISDFHYGLPHDILT